MGKDKYNSSLLESLKLQYSFNLDNFCKSDDGIVIEVNSYKESRNFFHDNMLLLFAYQRKMLTLMTAGRETKRADGWRGGQESGGLFRVRIQAAEVECEGPGVWQGIKLPIQSYCK